MIVFHSARILLRLSIAALVVFAPVDGSARSFTDPSIDSEHLHASMARMESFRREAPDGAEGIAYSVSSRDALRYLATLMQDAGMMTHIDVAGNLIGRHQGRQSLPPLVLGSHIDTVTNGAYCNHSAGAIAAIEIASTLHEEGLVLEHPLEIIIWSNSESGTSGSRSINGSIEARAMQQPGPGGRTIGEGIAFLGGDPENISANQRAAGEIAAYLELQITKDTLSGGSDFAIGIAGRFDDTGGNRMRSTIDAVAKGEPLSSKRLNGDNAPDAKNMALLAPAGVIFVAGTDANRHAPCNATATARIADGTNLLLLWLLELDAWHQARSR